MIYNLDAAKTRGIEATPLSKQQNPRHETHDQTASQARSPSTAPTPTQLALPFGSTLAVVDETWPPRWAQPNWSELLGDGEQTENHEVHR